MSSSPAKITASAKDPSTTIRKFGVVLAAVIAVLVALSWWNSYYKKHHTASVQSGTSSSGSSFGSSTTSGPSQPDLDPSAYHCKGGSELTATMAARAIVKVTSYNPQITFSPEPESGLIRIRNPGDAEWFNPESGEPFHQSGQVIEVENGTDADQPLYCS